MNLCEPAEAAAYAQGRERHRPQCQATIEREIRRLTADGLKPRDVASSLGVHVLVVVHVLKGTRNSRETVPGARHAPAGGGEP